MAKPQPVEIAGHQFESKLDALAFMKAMLNRYRPGDAVNTIDGAFLSEALKGHPEALEKIGRGIRSFEVRSADFGTQCFWAVRIDGSEDRFSYKSCL